MQWSCTKLDLAHAATLVRRLMRQPRKEHYEVVKRIFWYQKGTPDVGLYYKDENLHLIIVYSDYDYVGDVGSKRSMTGFVFTLDGYAVSWKTTLHLTITLSTIEAEYMTLIKAFFPQNDVNCVLENMPYNELSGSFCIYFKMSLICCFKQPYTILPTHLKQKISYLIRELTFKL